MPFSYHPPTGRACYICEELHQKDLTEPIIDYHNGKASSANNFPFHNWYNFVLGYSPEFPNYILRRENINSGHLVIDPFMGTGTTLICCKALGIPSKGIDANDFMVDAAKAKLDWDIDVAELRKLAGQLAQTIELELGKFNWFANSDKNVQLSLFLDAGNSLLNYSHIVENHRPQLLLQKYISDKPFAKLTIIANLINGAIHDSRIKNIFNLALNATIVPVSNIKYGPGFGIGKIKDDVDVLTVFLLKLSKIIKDLESVEAYQRNTLSCSVLGDTRFLSSYFEANSADFMITSPPYPGDHEYTKYTKLELLFRGYASTMDEFRVIKKRMLRASTTNLYNEDNDRAPIAHLDSLNHLTDLIEQRLIQDGASSGFEKLYTKVTWEYFGGMFKALAECYKVLRPGGKIALLVSDSHAFKMVHIQTAKLLQEIGYLVGYSNAEVLLWQLKTSTSHKYYNRENILILTKPLIA
jgi:DNA modification methylase